MQDQLSLFSQEMTTAQERRSQLRWELDEGMTAVDELLAIGGRWRNANEYLELLNCLTRLPQYSLFNAFLLYLQNPRVSQVATAGTWARRHSRFPRQGARPLIILAPMAPVLFVYDVRDTDGPALSGPSQPTPVHGGAPLGHIIETIRANCRLHGICLRSADPADSDPEPAVRLTAATRKRYRQLEPSPRASYLILLEEQATPSTNYRRLVFGLGQIFCGHYGIDANAWWPERAALSSDTEDFEAHSVACLIGGRQSAFNATEFLSPYLDQDSPLPPFSLNAVIQAAGYIEDMGKQPWGAPRKKSRYRP